MWKLRTLNTLTVFACVLLIAHPANAIIPDDDLLGPEEIVDTAQLVIDGVVVEVVQPTVAGEDRAVSVAVVRVLKTFKGELKTGARIRVLFWGNIAQFRAPADYRTFAVGQRLLFPLYRRTATDYQGFHGLDQAGDAAWHNDLLAEPFYYDLVQDQSFRPFAEVWRDPFAHMHSSRLRSAATATLLRRPFPARGFGILMGSDRLVDQRLGVRIATQTRSHEALAPLLLLLERLARVFEAGYADPTTWAGPDPYVVAMFHEAQTALRQIHLHGWTDGPALARFALSGAMDDHTLHRLLDVGAARWEVRDALLSVMARQPTYEGLATLGLLDARAAYPFLKRLEHTSDPFGRDLPLLARYHTAWSARVSLERGAPISRTLSSLWLRTILAFAPVPKASTSAETTIWADLLAQSSLGPSTANLSTALGRVVRWTVHRPSTGSVNDLAASDHRAIAPMLVESLTDEFASQSVGPEATWIVDIVASGAEGRGPQGQLWVAADGRFGFSWLPDRTWGQSSALAAMMNRIGPEAAVDDER